MGLESIFLGISPASRARRVPVPYHRPAIRLHELQHPTARDVPGNTRRRPTGRLPHLRQTNPPSRLLPSARLLSRKTPRKYHVLPPEPTRTHPGRFPAPAIDKPPNKSSIEQRCPSHVEESLFPRCAGGDVVGRRPVSCGARHLWALPDHSLKLNTWSSSSSGTAKVTL